jgi:hypothetical protein
MLSTTFDVPLSLSRSTENDIAYRHLPYQRKAQRIKPSTEHLQAEI